MKVICVGLLASLLLFACSPKLAPDSNWAEGKWILIELKEVPVQISGNDSRDAHIEFQPSSKNYNGFGGCNRISGTYSIGKSDIHFMSSMAALAGCPDVPFETTFLSLLGEVNKYSLSGEVLSLKKGNTTLMKLQRKL